MAFILKIGRRLPSKLYVPVELIKVTLSKHIHKLNTVQSTVMVYSHIFMVMLGEERGAA